MTAPELNPCPICGKPPQVSPQDPKKEGDAWMRIECEHTRAYCLGEATYGFSVHVIHETQARVRAVALWNRFTRR